ncbi:uncharacterized protein ISCGN_010770 [Ixodes scapularis]
MSEPPTRLAVVSDILLPALEVSGRRIISSSGAAIAAQPGRGDRHDADTSHNQIILTPLPTGSAVLNTVFLHADVRGRLYRVEDFRDTLAQLVLLPEVLALGAYQMNHVWAGTFKSSEGKRRALAAGDLVVKGKRCLVIDPGSRDVRLKLHWLLFHVPDDEVRVALSPYGKVIEVGTEKWRVQGVTGCGSMTRTAVIRLKPGVSLDDLPHQLKIAGGLALVVAPGRAPLCLRCQRTGHIRRECRVPKCESCKRFGHDADHCVRTYATATGPGGSEANAELVMDEADAEAANEGVATTSEASDGMAKSDAVRPADYMTIVMVTCENRLELTLTNLKSILAFSRASFRLIIYADAKNINDLQVRDMLPKEDAVLYLDADILLLRPVEELWRIFHSMGPSHLIAQAYEIEDIDTNPYRHYGAKVRLKLRRLPAEVPDDLVRKALKPFVKVERVERETWREETFSGVETNTRIVRLKLKDGVTTERLPHQLRVLNANIKFFTN